MDFSIDEESRESYDRVGDPISEEIITEETLNDSGAILNTKSNTVANYEMNKTITRKVKPVGIIDSVNVAALINVKYETNEKEILELINKDQTIRKHINGKIIKRKIFIKNKLINLII